MRSYLYFFVMSISVLLSTPFSILSYHQSKVAEQAVEQVRAILNDWEIRRRAIELGLIENPYKPSLIEQTKEIMANALNGATRDIDARIRKGEITHGQAIKEVFMNIARTGAEMAWEAMPLIATFVGISVAAYGAKRGFDLLKEYYMMRMNTPVLIRHTLQPHSIKKRIEDLHYAGKTKDQIRDAIEMAKTVVELRGRAKFQNIMLWGDPGTGKTAVVEIVAKEAGMTLFKTSGGDFAKLRGKDLQQIDQLFDRAKRSRKPVLLFIDEMENLFGARSNGTMSEDRSNILTKLLAELSSPSSQILVIGATNRPEDLDEAIQRRFPQQIQVGLPDKEGRIAIIEIYKRQLFDEDKNYSKQQKAEISNLFSKNFVETMADRFGLLSPAEIENIMISIKNKSFMKDKTGVPTSSLIFALIDEKLEILSAQKNGFVRNSKENKQQ